MRQLNVFSINWQEYLSCLYFDQSSRYNYFTVLLLWTVLAVGKSSAQEPVPLHFESYTIDNGLSQGFISSIVQDKQGFMWFGTSDGLNRYDGYTFTVFHHDPANPASIASDDISCLFADFKGQLWIGFRGKGIDIFNSESKTFRHIRPSKSGLRSGFVVSVAQDKSGTFWIKTREGIDRLGWTKDSAVFTPIRLDSNFERQRNRIGVEDFLIDSRNRKFIATNTTVSELIFNDSLRTYKLVERFHFAPVTSSFVGALLEDTLNHSLLLRDGTSIRKFPDYNFGNSRSIAVGLGEKAVRWTIDKSRHLWLYSGDYIMQVNTRRNRQRRVQADAAEDTQALKVATVFYTDRTGVVWIGSGGYGLLKYDPATSGFHHIMRETNIYQLLEGKDGKVVTSNLNALLLTEDSTYNQPNYIGISLLRTYQNMSFSRDTAGNFWFGISGALLRYDPLRKAVQRFEIPFTEYITKPFPMLADQADNIWMGYNRYLVKYSVLTGRFSKYEYPANYFQYDYDFLQSIYQDEDLLWLGSVNGLFCFDMKEDRMVRTYLNDEQDSTSISNNVALSFCADVENPDRYLWIGTKGGGLNRLNKATGRFSHFTTKQGLANNVVYGILPDYEGNLWLSTNKGLSIFNIASRRFRNFDVSDGLQSNEFNRYAHLRTSEGIMIFGGLNGLNYFRSDEVSPLYPPPVVFTDFRLFNRSIEPGGLGSLLEKGIGFTKNITLRYKQNVITFQFAAMDYRKKGSIRYRYRLEGFDEDWTYSGIVHEATYTNLNPGNYRFIVQASFENGEWSSESASVQVYIITPWDRSWWFFLFIAIATAAAAYGLYRFRLYQLRRVEGLRNRIAMDLHDEVGSSISSIAIYSKIVQEQMDSLTFDKQPLLKQINDFATEIMNSMNEIVWSINTKNDAFEHIISRMREHAIQLFEAKGCQLHFSFDESVARFKLDMERRREFYLIYKEALNNIAKYAEAQNVWIILSTSDNRITLKVRDDGKGFNLNDVKKSGNGLNNMQQRATMLHGKLSMTSGIGEGTEIVLIFTPF